jgi:hypothetical protein
MNAAAAGLTQVATAQFSKRKVQLGLQQKPKVKLPKVKGKKR